MPNIPIITLTTLIKKCDNILVQTLDNDIIMANIDNGHYYGVNTTSKRIWELLESHTTCDTICSIMTKEYKVDRTTCEHEILAFVQEMFSEGLIEVV